MTLDISAAFEIKDWDEQPFDEGVDVAKLTKAAVTKEYSGDVEGTSATQWLMAYRPDGSADFVGLERIRGTLNGRRGSLVLLHVGSYSAGVATATLTVVSGTDELTGATGRGKLDADPAGRVTLSVDV
jgi:hypothetical protein